MSKIWPALIAVAALALSAAAVAEAHAASNPTIAALEQTPVSLFTYGLDALSEGVNSTIGRGATPPAFAMFKAPLSGKIADMANVNYDAEAGTITINLVLIQSIDIPDDGADEACSQGVALVRFIAELDPATGQLQAGTGMKYSGLASYFSTAGTPAKSPADDLSALDPAFQLRYVFGTSAGHFECRAPLFGTTHTLKKMAY